jgi:beta-glucosidase
VTFSLEAPRDLRRYDEAGGAYAVPPGAYEVRVGASSADIRARAGFSVEAVHGKH